MNNFSEIENIFVNTINELGSIIYTENYRKSYIIINFMDMFLKDIKLVLYINWTNNVLRIDENYIDLCDNDWKEMFINDIHLSYISKCKISNNLS